MARQAKRTQAAATEEKSLEQLMLDQSQGKYALVPLASNWALELRRREEYRHLTQNELLDLAIRELLTGKVTEAEVLKAKTLREEASSALDGKKEK